MVAWDNTNNEVGKDGKRHSSSHSMSAISIDSDPGGRMRSYIASRGGSNAGAGGLEPPYPLDSMEPPKNFQL